MRYTNDDFVRLMSAVEAVGGEHLEETCAMDEVTYKIQGKTVVEMTHGCENETLFVVPYDPTETVIVPEPLLENDPDRGSYIAPDGSERRVRRSVKTKDDDGNEHVMFELVERTSEVDYGGELNALPVKVCAVGDNVGAWPRFRAAMQDSGTG